MSNSIIITGGSQLIGNVTVSGAKNSALPLLFATLLTDKACILKNVPDIEDISVTIRLLKHCGANVVFSDHELRVQTKNITNVEASYALVKKLRASFWLLGPLLARTGEARIALPGGDAIGTRPVDIHLKGLTALGADIRLQNGMVVAKASQGLHGARIVLDFPSVGATHNLLMAASLIEGDTILENAAREPEIVELCLFLKRMGATIEGIGSSSISIHGKRTLGSGKCTVIGDRIEAATYLAACAVTGGQIMVEGITPQALGKTLDVLAEAGCIIKLKDHGINIQSSGELSAVSFETAPSPGLATDVQPILMAMLTKSSGTSIIKENVFENRYGHVAEYRRLGADIEIDDRMAVVRGVSFLTGAPVEAGDIRAAAGLVLMGLGARGETTVHEIFHLERGYENMVQKLSDLGAQIRYGAAYEDRDLIFGC
ncbi:MAG: UDP-N-acetylglucosamine 1-carboxyvinyltransferase [Deltaproteobacteria bacterium]|nr:UDP-N-acetylglucosamine 1-carboxyvinyltransferase [Deltaproteobacteria bacterium]